MATYTAPRPDCGFIMSEANGFKSRGDLTLKTSATVYAAGTLVISEFASDVKTGKYVRATQTLVDAEETADFAIINEATDATAADAVGTGVFVRDGEVKGKALVLDASITVSEATALLAKQGVIVR